LPFGLVGAGVFGSVEAPGRVVGTLTVRVVVGAAVVVVVVGTPGAAVVEATVVVEGAAVVLVVPGAGVVTVMSVGLQLALGVTDTESKVSVLVVYW